MLLAFADPLSGYSFTIQSYQWGYTEGTEYVTREFGTTPFGTWHRQGTNYTQSWLTVRFVGIDTVIDQLQTMTMIVQRHGGPVKFYPDATLPAYALMLWPVEMNLSRIIENREEAELVLVNATGTPGLLAHDRDRRLTVSDDPTTVKDTA